MRHSKVINFSFAALLTNASSPPADGGFHVLPQICAPQRKRLGRLREYGDKPIGMKLLDDVLKIAIPAIFWDCETLINEGFVQRLLAWLLFTLLGTARVFIAMINV